MSRKRSTISKNADFVHQIIDSVITAISEHKWKQASLLLPSVTALSRRKISPYFIWKILHSIMSSTNIPLAMQIQILQVTLKSSVKSYDMILDILANKFEAINEQDFETLYESVNESQKSRDLRNLLRSTCLSYFALFYYLKWKRLLNLQEPSICKMKSSQLTNEEKRKELGKLALKAQALLNKVYSLLQSSDIEDTKGEYHEKSVPCEWLLGPLLDVEAYTKMENTYKNRKKQAENDYHGLELIEKYVKNHRYHIPALRTFYFYMIAHHSQEEKLIFEILEKIVLLSPDSSLVLQYTLSLLSKESIMIGASQDSKKNRPKSCRLESKNVETLLKCLKLLTEFIEYKMWRKDVGAWNALKDILIVFHESWISCWECHHCISSRKQIEDFSERLSSWSEFIWHETQLQLLTLENAEILVYMGYTSFVLGYSEKIAKKAIECLENLECHDEAKNLLELMRQKGSYMRDFLIHLLNQRKKRNVYENQDTTGIESKSYSALKIEVCFSDFKFGKKNYFSRANHSCLTMEKKEACEIFPSNENTIDTYSESEMSSGEKEFNVIEDGSCNSKSYVMVSSRELKNVVENCGIKNNENLSEMDHFTRKREPSRGTSNQMVKNINGSCTKKDISKVKKTENEQSCYNTLKEKSEIGNEVKLHSNSASSESGPSSCSAAAEKPKTSRESNKITFGRKRKLSNDSISQENKKRCIM